MSTSPFYAHGLGTVNSGLYMARREVDLRVWKRRLIEILKASPSKERKFLRWVVCEREKSCGLLKYIREVLEEGELEVFPETFL